MMTRLQDTVMSSTSPFPPCVWDAGRMLVNPAFCDLLSGAGLTTFDRVFGYREGELVRQVGSRRTVRVALESSTGTRTVYLKRFEPLPWRERMRALIRLRVPEHGAAREWRAILALHRLAIPTLTPIAMGEHAGRSFLLTEGLLGYQDLKSLVRGGMLGVDEQAYWMREIAAIARRLHASGLHHQDFYLNHFLLSPDGQDLRLIDLGRVCARTNLAYRWVVKDLAQLNYSALGVSRAVRLRFLAQYLGRALGRSDRRLISRLEAKARRIDRHTRKHRL